jgi:catechol 2,3-dioxygenase-like lactoylglutathione lyase family enzyme
MGSVDVSTKTDAAQEVKPVDMKLEVILLGVSDVGRAKAFYEKLGWRLDADFTSGDQHAVQVTPPGSQCSVHFGTNLTAAKPGSAQALLIASDIQAARDELVRRDVDVSEVYHYDGLNRVDPAKRLSGFAPNRSSYGSFLSFSDPDGNVWLVQEITTRLPGRVDPGAVSFGSAAELASAFRRAEAAHGEHEKLTGVRDVNWPEWYAAYMVAEQAGTELPT